MRVYLAELIIGTLALDEKGNVVDYELGPRDMDSAAEEALKMERGELSSATVRLLSKLEEKGVKELVVETEEIAKKLISEGFDAKVEVSPQPIFQARANVAKLAVELGFSENEEEFIDFLHKTSIEITRRKLRGAAQKRDLLAVQAIRAIDDIDRTINLYAARVREWYSLHFPELDDLIREHEDFVRLVAELGHRESFTKDAIVKLGFSEAKASRIADAASRSIGADLSDFDVKPIQVLAGITSRLYELRRELADYISAVMKEVAPNVTALVGPLLGARLLSLAGSLEELARLPASTIQVLGAEKALFRALRTGGKPPKHGVIFQYPDIHRSPRWQRGKIARALAAKLAIAAKIDAFTGRYIGDQLKEVLRKRIEEIKKLYAKPPVRKKEERVEARPPKFRGRPGKPRKKRR